MKATLVAGLVASGLVVILSAIIGRFVSAEQNALLSPALVIAAGATVFLVKRRREGLVAPADDAQSAAQSLAERAQSSALRDGILAGTILGAAALFVSDLPASMPVTALVLIMAADFWIRYGLLLHRESRKG
jgi:hypothetical protein